MVYSRMAAGLLLVASSAGMAGQFDQSDRWQQVASTSTGSVWYIDRPTMKSDGRTASAWITMDHRRDRTERARQTRGLIEIECGGRQFHWVQNFSYRPNGSALPERVRPNVTMPIVSGSPVEAVSQALCQGGGR
jgi:hypothetical protein